MLEYTKIVRLRTGLKVKIKCCEAISRYRQIDCWQNNAKATTICRKAGGMAEPREWDRLIRSTWRLALSCSHDPVIPWWDYSQVPRWLTGRLMWPRGYSQRHCQTLTNPALDAASRLFPTAITEVFGWRESTITTAAQLFALHIADRSRSHRIHHHHHLIKKQWNEAESYPSCLRARSTCTVHSTCPYPSDTT